MVYLGGGPGSETHLPEIIKYKALYPDTITICAGKIYRMLLSQNFVPDYVIITDAKPSLAWQLRDLPQTAAELLYLSTASNSAVDTFCGKKYIFFQKDFAESEDFAREHSLLLFETGGSVSTAAIDFALRMGCSTLITTDLTWLIQRKKVMLSKFPATSQTRTTISVKKTFTERKYLQRQLFFPIGNGSKSGL